ncbi:Nn.00g020930.m01.CDS01 [Neocucurbitaria sp. VM-36]
MGFKQQPYFQYDPLDQLQDSFRLCKLLPGGYSAPVECELFPGKFSERSDLYYALSYTWGKTQGPRWIRLNRKPFHVQPNLFAALKAIRKVDTELIIWVDALCINQLEEAERNHQVSQMGKIYSNAKEVLAWIGPAANDSDFLLAYTKKHHGSKADDGKDGRRPEIPAASKEDKRLALRAFNSFIKRDYWHRAWIVQELILAKEVSIYCGTKSVDGFRFFLMGCFNFAVGKSNDATISNIFTHRSKLESGEPESLEQLLVRYSRTDCANPRDKIYSLLSLASDCSGNIESFVDYSVGVPAIFFAILCLLKPADITKLVATLQYVLQVRTMELIDFWEQVAEDKEVPKAKSPMEETALMYVWAAKNMLRSPEYSAWKTCASAKELAAQHSVDSSSDTEWLMRCCLYAQETNQAEEMVAQIEGTNFCILLKPTLYGLMFQEVYKDMNDAQSMSDDESDKEKDGKIKRKSEWSVYNPPIEEKELEVAAIIAQHVSNPDIKLSSSGVAGDGMLDIYATSLLRAIAGGGGKRRRSVESSCRVLIELRRQSPYGICLAICRYILMEIDGHVVAPARAGR